LLSSDSAPVAVALAGLGNGKGKVMKKKQGFWIVLVLLESGLVQGEKPGDHMGHFFLRHPAQGIP